MTFTAQQFAHAFVGAIQDARRRKSGTGRQASEVEMIQRAAQLLDRAGKARHLPKILSAIESAWAKKTGARKITITSALPKQVEIAEALKLSEEDSVENIIDTRLVAGLIIKENDNRILDLSFRSRVNQLFKIRN